MTGQGDEYSLFPILFPMSGLNAKGGDAMKLIYNMSVHLNSPLDLHHDFSMKAFSCLLPGCQCYVVDYPRLA